MTQTNKEYTVEEGKGTLVVGRDEPWYKSNYTGRVSRAIIVAPPSDPTGKKLENVDPQKHYFPLLKDEVLIEPKPYKPRYLDKFKWYRTFKAWNMKRKLRKNDVYV